MRHSYGCPIRELPLVLERPLSELLFWSLLVDNQPGRL